MKLLSIKIVFSIHNLTPHTKQFGSSIDLLRTIYKLGDLHVYHTQAYELIKPFRVNIYQREYVNSANQKNWALQFCKNGTLKGLGFTDTK